MFRTKKNSLSSKFWIDLCFIVWFIYLNFTVVKGKNYTRFVSKGTSVIMKQVNNDFRAFILIDKNLHEQQQSSFLNWFEKHYLNYKNLLDEILVKFILICFNCLKIIIKKNF